MVLTPGICAPACWHDSWAFGFLLLWSYELEETYSSPTKRAHDSVDAGVRLRRNGSMSSSRLRSSSLAPDKMFFVLVAIHIAESDPPDSVLTLTHASDQSIGIPHPSHVHEVVSISDLGTLSQREDTGTLLLPAIPLQQILLWISPTGSLLCSQVGSMCLSRGSRRAEGAVDNNIPRMWCPIDI